MYHTRSFRLRLESPDGLPARARIRYLGDATEATIPPRFADPSLELIGRPEPGSRGRLHLRVRNTGSRAWAADGVAPVQILTRLRPLAAPDTTARSRDRRVDLPAPVESGDLLDVKVPIRWPRRAGRYRLEVDLARAGVGRFTSHQGSLASLEIDIPETTPSENGDPSPSP